MPPGFFRVTFEKRGKSFNIGIKFAAHVTKNPKFKFLQVADKVFGGFNISEGS